MKPRLPASARTWTRRAILLIETAIVLFWLGIVLQNGRFIITSAIIFSYLILALAFTTTPNKALSLRRRLSTERILEEQPVQVMTVLENGSLRPALVHVEEAFPEPLEILEGGQRYAAIVQGKSITALLGILRADFRGHYVIPAPAVKSADEFGLREVDLKMGGPAYLSVIPPVEDLSDFALDSRTSQPEIGTFRSSSVGVGTEFFGIRDYMPGDDLRRVNWKASARTDTLLANEYEREHVTNIYLFVDLTTSRVDALKWTVRTAASIATYLLRTRNRLGLIVLGESTSHVRIESGRRQLLRVLDKLITVEPGGTGEASTYLLRLLEEMPQCETLVISALASEPIAKTVIALRSKHERVAVITRTPMPPIEVDRDLVVKAAWLMYALRRRATIQHVRNAEIRVIEIPSDKPIRTAVSMIRERPMRR